MKTKLLFTTLLLTISLYAACMTAKDFVNPYYPKNIYGEAKLDSVIESGREGDEIHVLFDEMGRMAVQKIYELDEGTSQYKLNGTYEFGYADGAMFTSTHVHFWDPEENQWMDYNYKFEDIVYNAAGDPVSWTMYEWNAETNKWEDREYNKVQYDSYGNVVLERDSSLGQLISTDSLGNQVIGDPTWEVNLHTYSYKFDGEGRVIMQMGNNNQTKTEYTYNSQGDIKREKESYLFISWVYDGKKDEYIPDSTWNISAVRNYSYDSLSNLVKVIEDGGNGIVRNQIVYYYSLPFQAIEDIHINADTSRKIFHNGQLFFLRGKEVYTVTGQKLR